MRLPPLLKALVLTALALAALSAPGCVSSKKKSEKATTDTSQFVLESAPAGLQKLGVNFDNKVTLLGYTMDNKGTVKPGQQVTYTLYWKTEKELGETGWKLFTHVLNDKGRKFLNIDAVGPIREYKGSSQVLPPSSWKAGKIYVDQQTFTLPKSYKGKKLAIITGLWKGKRRLPVVGSKKRTHAVIARLKTGGKRKSTKPKQDLDAIPTLRVNKLASGEKIKIDGKLDDAAWQAAAATGAFVNVSTGEFDKKARVQGSAKLTWDDSTMYVGFQVEDTDVIGGFKLIPDSHLWTKDTIEIMIDPDGDGDNKDYYEIQVNPQNLVFDSQFDDYNQPKKEPNGPFGHEEWSSGIKSAVVIDGTIDKSDDQDKGYTVEIALPWWALRKAKKAPPNVGDEWRMNLYAMQNNGGVAWSPIRGKGNFHKASRFGRVLWATKDWTPTPAPAPTSSAVADAKEMVGKDAAKLNPPKPSTPPAATPVSAPALPKKPNAPSVPAPTTPAQPKQP